MKGGIDVQDNKSAGSAVHFHPARRYVKSRRLAWCLAMLGAAGGCSVDERGLGVRSKRLESPRGLEIDAWGVHLSTRQSDAGVTVGHYRQTYLYEPTTRPASQPASRPEADPGTARDEGRVIATIGRTIGANVQANPGRVGVSIGARWQEALFLPPDFDGLLIFEFDSERPERLQLYRKEIPE